MGVPVNRDGVAPETIRPSCRGMGYQDHQRTTRMLAVPDKLPPTGIEESPFSGIVAHIQVGRHQHRGTRLRLPSPLVPRRQPLPGLGRIALESVNLQPIGSDDGFHLAGKGVEVLPQGRHAVAVVRQQVTAAIERGHGSKRKPAQDAALDLLLDDRGNIDFAPFHLYRKRGG